MTEPNDAIDPRLIALGLGAPAGASASTRPAAPEPPPVAETVHPSAPPAFVSAPSPAAQPAQSAVAAPASFAPTAPPARPQAPEVRPLTKTPAVVPAAPAAKPAKPVAKPTAKPSAPLVPSLDARTGGMTVHVYSGFPARPAVLTFDTIGVHVSGTKKPFGVPWSAVTDVRESRGQVLIRTAKERVALTVAIDGITEPALAGPLARLLEDARSGTIDRSGSAALDFRNGADRLRDEFADEDDVFTPAVVGVVFLACAAVAVTLVPHLLAMGTAPAVPAGIFVLDSRLSPFDPRSLAIGLAAAALLTALIVRVADGKHAAAWARGTLRGWHRGGRPVTLLARKVLATFVQRPALSAAVLLLGAALALPSARTVVVFGDSGVRVVRELPFLDDDRPWGAVSEISAQPAPFDRHPSGVSVTVRFVDGMSITTLGHHLQGGTDKQFFDVARIWRDAAAGEGRH